MKLKGSVYILLQWEYFPPTEKSVDMRVRREDTGAQLAVYAPLFSRLGLEMEEICPGNPQGFGHFLRMPNSPMQSFVCTQEDEC